MSAPIAFGIAADGVNPATIEFLSAVAFGLDEIVGPAGTIRRVAPLGDDAFETDFAGILENERPVPVEMLGVADQAVLLAVFSKSRECRLALGERLAGQVAAVEMQKIEDVIDEAIAAAIFQIGLQQREIADAVLILDDDFAVEQRGLGRQARRPPRRPA